MGSSGRGENLRMRLNPQCFEPYVSERVKRMSANELEWLQDGADAELQTEMLIEQTVREIAVGNNLVRQLSV
jgi:hypothetical protein